MGYSIRSYVFTRVLINEKRKQDWQIRKCVDRDRGVKREKG